MLTAAVWFLVFLFLGCFFFLMESTKENYVCMQKKIWKKISTSSYLGIFKYLSLYKCKPGYRLSLNIESVRGNLQAN